MRPDWPTLFLRALWWLRIEVYPVIASEDGGRVLATVTVLSFLGDMWVKSSPWTLCHGGQNAAAIRSQEGTQSEVHTNMGTAVQKAAEKQNLIPNQAEPAIHPTFGFSMSVLVKPIQAGFSDVAKSILTSKCFHKTPLLVDFLAKCINICFFSLKVQIFNSAVRVRLIVSFHLFFCWLV